MNRTGRTFRRIGAIVVAQVLFFVVLMWHFAGDSSVSHTGTQFSVSQKSAQGVDDKSSKTPAPTKPYLRSRLTAPRVPVSHDPYSSSDILGISHEHLQQKTRYLTEIYTNAVISVKLLGEHREAPFLPEGVLQIDSKLKKSPLRPSVQNMRGGQATTVHPHPMFPGVYISQVSFAHDKYEIVFGATASSGERDLPFYNEIVGSSKHGLRANYGGAPDGGTEYTFSFPETTVFFGISNRGNNVKIPPGTTIRLFNLDVNHYQVTPGASMYGSIPLLYAGNIGKQRSTVGIFWLNSGETWVTVEGNGHQVTFKSREGGVQMFFFPGPSPEDVLQQYYSVVGRPQFPPLFALGYHQCRWSYKTQADVLEVNDGFDQHQIPMDVMWLDVDHTDDKQYFTWDTVRYPNPEEMQNRLAKSGRKLVTITDPHIKRRPGYHVYDEAHAKKYFVSKANQLGTEFSGHCWSGDSSWIDFLNPEARSWYASLFSFDKYKHSTKALFTWIDMNEPSVFSGPEITLPSDTLHHGKVRHSTVHNTYGFYHTMAAYEGLERRSNREQRPFLLTRSFFPGSHRYAFIWTGDNQARWDHLRASVHMTLTASITGMTYVGADVGGFFDHPDKELLTRWFQLGAVYPFYRSHSHEATPRREPWLFGKAVTDALRTAIRLRYQLLPYLYQCARAVHVGDAAAIVKPLFFAFPHDERVYEGDCNPENPTSPVFNTFMLGDALLAAPILHQHQTELRIFFPLPLGYFGTVSKAAPRLPGWYDFHSGEPIEITSTDQTVTFAVTPNSPLPLFVREGTIVTAASNYNSLRSSEDYRTSPKVSLIIAPSSGATHNTFSVGSIYVDDGNSFDYRDAVNTLRVEATFEGPTGELKLNVVSPSSTASKHHDLCVTITEIVVFGGGKKYSTFRLKNKEVQLGGEWRTSGSGSAQHDHFSADGSHLHIGGGASSTVAVAADLELKICQEEEEIVGQFVSSS